MQSPPAAPVQSRPPLVQIDRLSCGYDGTPVLRDVSLNIAEGQFAGIVGPSGSGKTTLIRALLGAVDLYAGRVVVDGQPVERGRTGRLRIGYVPQLESVDWNFPVTVEQVVLMGLAADGGFRPWIKREQRQRMMDLLDHLGIVHLVRRHIRDLSGGQQQRVFLARALLRDPKLLILDEPTAGADIKTRHDMLHLLSGLNREGTTIFLSTHDLNSVAAHLPWVICLNGHVVAEGHPDEVFTPEILGRTYGAEMVVLRQGNLILVSDKLGALRGREGHEDVREELHAPA